MLGLDAEGDSVEEVEKRRHIFVLAVRSLVMFFHSECG